MMNRKGHVPTVMLVFFTLAMALVALFAFLSFSNGYGGGSEEISSVVRTSIFSQDYVLNTAGTIGRESILKGGDVKSNFVELAAERDLRVKEFGDFFGKVRTRSFDFDKEGDKYILEVEKVFVVSGNGDTRIKKNFDIKIEFNGDGSVRKVYK